MGDRNLSSGFVCAPRIDRCKLAEMGQNQSLKKPFDVCVCVLVYMDYRSKIIKLYKLIIVNNQLVSIINQLLSIIIQLLIGIND